MSVFKTITATFFVGILAAGSLQAAGNFPRGCEVSGFGYSNNNLVLNDNGVQAFYLIQNRSTTKIDMQRFDTAETFMSPPLQATIEPMNWAAFASDVQNMNFKCYKHDTEEAVPVDCREVLDICRYPRVKFALSNMGNYWISINKSQYDVIQEAVAKGIYLKW